MTTRTLTPELLDSLPPSHPDALHSRRDLRWINWAMGNHRWFARTLPPLLHRGESALELGAGTGELGLRLLARGVAVDGLDYCPRPARWPQARGWHVGDLRHFPHYAGYAAVCGNLILHHCTDAELAELGATLRRSVRLILVSEPTRSPRSQRLIALAGRALGASRVTLHDAHVSIAAGFVGDELPRLLGLDPAEWEISCSTTFLGACRMRARRRA
jgi:hypothetical protein